MRRGWILALALSTGLSAGAANAEGEAVGADAAAVDQRVDLESLVKSRKIRQIKYAPRERITRYANKAVEVLGEGDVDGAVALLERLNLKRLNPYERALILKLFGYVSYQAGEPEAAIAHFDAALAEDVLSLKDEKELRFSIAQLYAGLTKWPETIAAVDAWARYVPQRTPRSHYLMAIAYYQLEDFDSAIGHSEKSVDLAPEPKESWFQLLAALYVKQQDYKSAAPVLEEMVMRFRKKEYWAQLSLIYGALDNFRGSLAVQQIAYTQGLLSEDKELRRLARGFLYNELPHPAALVLQEGLEEGAIEGDAAAYELLANSWIAAREYDRSLEPLTKAASLSEDGNLFIRLGQVHMQREEWRDAVVLFQRALEKGDLKETGNAHLLLGISQYNDDLVARARASFARARKHEDTRVDADNWLKHIEKEAQQSS